MENARLEVRELRRRAAASDADRPEGVETVCVPATTGLVWIAASRLFASGPTMVIEPRSPSAPADDDLMQAPDDPRICRQLPPVLPTMITLAPLPVMETSCVPLALKMTAVPALPSTLM